MDAWDAGDLYEQYMGRWNRRIAPAFVAWLGGDEGGRWLDVGCGTGALAGAIVDARRAADVIGIDPSEAFVEAARRGVPGARFEVGDARSLPHADASFDVCASALALNFVPDPTVAVREMRRVARPGGIVAAYVWDYADGMELLRAFWDAAIAIDPDAADRDEARRFPLCTPDRLGAAWVEAGLGGIELEVLRTPTAFATFDELWRPFLGGQGLAPSYVAGLTPPRRAELEALLRARLAPDGSEAILLTAAALAVKGKAPR